MSFVSKESFRFFPLLAFAFSVIACKDFRDSDKNPRQFSSFFEKERRDAEDSLVKRGLGNYIDSAYWYAYIYFGGSKIKGCRTVDINSVLPDTSNRKIIYQDLVLRRVRFSSDSPFVFIRVTPLIQDSILSCDMVEGPQLPNEIMFNYQTKTFMQFMYNENSWLRVNASPLNEYLHGLKKILDKDAKVGLKPHIKFRLLLEKISKNTDL